MSRYRQTHVEARQNAGRYQLVATGHLSYIKTLVTHVCISDLQTPHHVHHPAGEGCSLKHYNLVILIINCLVLPYSVSAAEPRRGWSGRIRAQLQDRVRDGGGDRLRGAVRHRVPGAVPHQAGGGVQVGAS